MIPLDEKVARLSTALDGANVPHAFGGAIALAYYATPRGTQDVDINIFLPADRFESVVAALLPLGVEQPTSAMRQTLARDEQVRLAWDKTPLDLFFSYNELHESCVSRTRNVPFGPERITILSAEDLAIFKVLFAREKDWRDLREIVFAQAPDFEAPYATSWLERILAPSDQRLVRFGEILAAHAVA